MKERLILADDNLGELGLGDLVNRFASIDSLSGTKTILLFRDFPQDGFTFNPEGIIGDIIKNKNIEIGYVKDLEHLDEYVLIEKGELNPVLETQLVFSDDELSWAKETLKKCNLDGQEKMLMICNNIPGKKERKMWLSQHWNKLVACVLRKNERYQVVLLPNFRSLDDQSDGEILHDLAEKFPGVKIFSFQEYIKLNLPEIIKAQKLFGNSKNDDGFSIRQFGAIFHELFENEKSRAVFNDTGLAHLAVASVGKIKSERIISVNVENEKFYRLRNGGKSFPLGDEKTDPVEVANFINKD